MNLNLGRDSEVKILSFKYGGVADVWLRFLVAASSSSSLFSQV